MNDRSLEKLAASSRRSAILSILGIVIVICSLGYSALKLSNTKEQVLQKQTELVRLEEILRSKTEELAAKTAALDSLNQQIEETTLQLAAIKSELEKLPASTTTTQLQSSFTRLDSAIGAADIDARAIVSPVSALKDQTPLISLIESLFGSSAAERGRAYEKLMSAYASDKTMISSLLQYADSHKSNLNGIYNTLVVLSHVNYGKLDGVDINAVRAFAESVRNNGDKTSQRVDVLLKRLPR